MPHCHTNHIYRAYTRRVEMLNGPTGYEWRQGFASYAGGRQIIRLRDKNELVSHKTGWEKAWLNRPDWKLEEKGGEQEFE